jgi:plasmid stabilization system protein ParE
VKSRFHNEAESDLAEAVEFYDGQAVGLGDRLVAEVRAAVAFIELYPDACAVIDQNIRGKVLVRFPHTLLYATDEEEILILAVAHQSQDRLTWRKILDGRRAGD